MKDLEPKQILEAVAEAAVEAPRAQEVLAAELQRAPEALVVEVQRAPMPLLEMSVTAAAAALW